MQTITTTLQHQGGFKKTTDKEFEICSITSGTEDNIITAGTGTGISFENPYITEKQVQDIYNRMVGVKYLPCSVKWRGNPASEAGDTVMVQDKETNNLYRAFICSQTLNLTGGFQSTVNSTGKADNAIQFDNITPTEKKIKQAYTTLQEAIAEASALINGAKGGIFRMTDSDGDGVNDGFILADRQDTELPVNAKCIVANYEGIGLSKDGGRTYENAITHNGINASKITTGTLNADLIKAGCIKSANNVALIDMLTGNITIKDSGNLLSGHLRFEEANNQQRYSYTNSVASYFSGDGCTSYFWKYGFTCYGENYKEVFAGVDAYPYIFEVKGSNAYCSGSWINGSLESLKKNISPVNKSHIDIIKNSEIYEYNLKFENDTDKKHYGFVIPDMGGAYRTPMEVTSQSGDGIDTYSMCSILWKAVQELTAKVEKLEAEKYKT